MSTNTEHKLADSHSKPLGPEKISHIQIYLIGLMVLGVFFVAIAAFVNRL